MIPVRPARTPRHPGRILVEDFLSKVPGLTQAQVADRLGISRPRLNEIVNGARGVTPDTALRLARGFGTAPEFWTGAQATWELYEAGRSRKRMREMERIAPLVESPLRGGERAPAQPEPAHPAPDLCAEIGVLAAAFATQPEGPTLEHYEEFLRRKGMLNEARRFVRIRAQLDELGRPTEDAKRRTSGKLPQLLRTAPTLTFTD